MTHARHHAEATTGGIEVPSNAGAGGCAAAVEADQEVIAFRLEGLDCRIVRVDDALPRQLKASLGERARHVYRDDELAHFHIGKHLYALVASKEDRASPGPKSIDARDLRAILTNRELQIVQLICMGLLTKQVADRLHLSEFTVRSYLKTIYCKLGVRSRGGMVYAYTKVFGLIVCDDQAAEPRE